MNAEHRTEFLVGTQAMIRYIAKWAENKGFWDQPNVLHGAFAADASAKFWVERLVKSQKLMLMVSELAELLEGLRKPAEAKVGGFTNEEEELADSVIRHFDYAGHFDLRLAECIIAKMEVNEGRPHRHGKNF